MALDSTQLRQLGLPPPEACGLQSVELLQAYRDLVENLLSRGRPAYANLAWERFQLTASLDSPAAARLAVFAALVPAVMRVIRELWEREGLEGEPEAHATEKLGMFGRLLSQIRSIQASRDFREFSSALPQNPSTGGIAAPPPGPQRALAGFDWTVRGARTTWAGQCFAWPFGEDWCLVTASWQTADISYTPVLLGFAARARWHRNIGEVLARTLGTVVGPEASVSTYFGFSGFEAAYIATCLHGTGSEDWENPLSALPDGDILRAIGFTEGGTIGMKVLVEALQAVRDAEAIIRDARDKSQGGTSS